MYVCFTISNVLNISKRKTCIWFRRQQRQRRRGEIYGDIWLPPHTMVKFANMFVLTTCLWRGYVVNIRTVSVR